MISSSPPILVKYLSAMQETWVRPLGWEDPLEKEMAIHSSILFFFFSLYWTCYNIGSGLCFHFSQGMWDLSSPTRDRTCTPCSGRQSLNHWTTREVPPLQYSFLENSMDKETGGLQSVGSQRVRHTWVTNTFYPQFVPPPRFVSSVNRTTGHMLSQDQNLGWS